METGESRVVGWQRDDEGTGHSVARLAREDDGWVAQGTEVLLGEDTFSCSLDVELDAGWRTRDASVSVVDGTGHRGVSLEVLDDLRWLVGALRRPDLDGAQDVDVAATPLTNTFPIRRLSGLAVGESWTLPVAWVDVPSLRVTRVVQTYTRLEPVEGLDVWQYADDEHGAFRLTVDADGLVVDYEGFARRVHP